MNKINKKLYIVAVIALCFMVGGTLSFESLARFTKKFDNISKKVTVANFKVEAINNLSETNTIKPGDVIGEDKITLKNDNDYPVEFTIKLDSKNESDKDLLKYLTLTINGADKVENTDNHYKKQLVAGEEQEVYTKLEWKIDEDIEIDPDILQGASVQYNYDITAKQVVNSNKPATSPETDTDNTPEVDSEDKSEEVPKEPETPDVEIGGSESSDEDNGLNREVLYKSNFINSTSLDGWVANDAKNNSKIKIEDNCLIIGTDSNTSLNNFEFNLKDEKIIFNSNIEILNTNQEKDNGLNFTLGVKSAVNAVMNNFTYKIYKEAANNNLYATFDNIANQNLTDPINIKIDENKITSNTLNLILVGELELKGDIVYCSMKVKGINGNILRESRTPIEGNPYSISHRFYINVSGIGESREGFKINSMEISKVSL